MNDFIIKTLNLKAEYLDYIHSILSQNNIDYVITLKQNNHICPNRGSLTHIVKVYKICPIIQKIFISYESIIYYKTRRYLCKTCNKCFIKNNSFGATRKK